MKQAEATAAHATSTVDEHHRRFKVDTWARGGGAVGRLLVDLGAGRR
jgi:hypothetical protein